MSVESFSERVVPFTWSTWMVVAIFYVIFLAHEVYAHKKKPLLAEQKEANMLAFQSSLLFYWFYVYVHQSLMISVSLDFAASMGQNATMSGFFISSLGFSDMPPLFTLYMYSNSFLCFFWALRIPDVYSPWFFCQIDFCYNGGWGEVPGLSP